MLHYKCVSYRHAKNSSGQDFAELYKFLYFTIYCYIPLQKSVNCMSIYILDLADFFMQKNIDTIDISKDFVNFNDSVCWYLIVFNLRRISDQEINFAYIMFVFLVVWHTKKSIHYIIQCSKNFQYIHGPLQA